jgi:hypothetical protein
MEKEKTEKSFVVKDRRMFSETGESRDENQADGAADDADGAATAKPEAMDETQKDAETADDDLGYPEINFANFIISLSTSAMFHFGDFADPATGKAEVNLEAAKQTIDIIGMLEEKTKNNLDAEEMRLVQNLLFELRMRYVKEKAEAGK